MVYNDFKVLYKEERHMEENMAQRIKRLRKKNQMTLEDVAKIVGVGKSTVRKWETGMIANMRRDKIALLAQAFNVEPSYLMGWEEKSSVDLFSIPGISSVKKIKLPILGNVACGEPIWAEQDYDGYIEVEGGVRADFCLRCQGDSMIGARIYDGDIVLVKKQPQVDNGEIAVVLINDEATLKRVAFYPEKQMLILKPENPNYQDMIFIGEELNEIKILGKAVAFQSVVR